MRGIDLDGVPVPVPVAPLAKDNLMVDDWMVKHIERELVESVSRSLFTMCGSLGKLAERSRAAEVAQIEFKRAYAAGIYTTGGS
jgi:hypothetical protein